MPTNFRKLMGFWREGQHIPEIPEPKDKGAMRAEVHRLLRDRGLMTEIAVAISVISEAWNRIEKDKTHILASNSSWKICPIEDAYTILHAVPIMISRELGAAMIKRVKPGTIFADELDYSFFGDDDTLEDVINIVAGRDTLVYRKESTSRSKSVPTTRDEKRDQPARNFSRPLGSLTKGAKEDGQAKITRNSIYADLLSSANKGTKRKGAGDDTEDQPTKRHRGGTKKGDEDTGNEKETNRLNIYAELLSSAKGTKRSADGGEDDQPTKRQRGGGHSSNPIYISSDEDVTSDEDEGV